MGSLLQKFSQTLGFTPTESKVVLFLIAMFLLGIAVRMLRDGRPPARYNDQATDSIFRARSLAVETPDSQMTAPPAQARMPGTPALKPKPHIVDINRATRDDLLALPGIGPAMAERIVAYRNANGPFLSVDDLGKVKGIGKKKLSRLVPYCTIGR